MNYKGIEIEEVTDAWPLHFGFKYQYSLDEETLHHAYTLDEAKDWIDEHVAKSWPTWTTRVPAHPMPVHRQHAWLTDAVKFCVENPKAELLTPIDAM